MFNEDDYKLEERYLVWLNINCLLENIMNLASLNNDWRRVMKDCFVIANIQIDLSFPFQTHKQCLYLIIKYLRKSTIKWYLSLDVSCLVNFD